MPHVAIAGMAVAYIRSTGEHVPATIIGPSTRGDDLFHVKYTRGTWGLAMRLRASFASPEMLLIAVLCQLNPFQTLQPRLLQSLPQRAACAVEAPEKVFYSTAPDAPDGQHSRPFVYLVPPGSFLCNPLC